MLFRGCGAQEWREIYAFLSIRKLYVSKCFNKVSGDFNLRNLLVNEKNQKIFLFQFQESLHKIRNNEQPLSVGKAIKTSFTV